MRQQNRIFLFHMGLAMMVMMSCAVAANKEDTKEYIDDTVITTKVKAAIYHDPALKTHEINVKAYKGCCSIERFCR